MLVRIESVNASFLLKNLVEIINQLRSNTTANCMLAHNVLRIRCDDMSALSHHGAQCTENAK